MNYRAPLHVVYICYLLGLYTKTLHKTGTNIGTTYTYINSTFNAELLKMSFKISLKAVSSNIQY